MTKFIYLITNNDAVDYDVYESAVVIALNEDEAKNIHPSGGKNDGYDWIIPSMVNVTKIGVVTEDVDDKFLCGDVISASYIGG